MNKKWSLLFTILLFSISVSFFYFPKITVTISYGRWMMISAVPWGCTHIIIFIYYVFFFMAKSNRLAYPRHFCLFFFFVEYIFYLRTFLTSYILILQQVQSCGIVKKTVKGKMTHAVEKKQRIVTAAARRGSRTKIFFFWGGGG